MSYFFLGFRSVENNRMNEHYRMNSNTLQEPPALLKEGLSVFISVIISADEQRVYCFDSIL